MFSKFLSFQYNIGSCLVRVNAGIALGSLKDNTRGRSSIGSTSVAIVSLPDSYSPTSNFACVSQDAPSDDLIDGPDAEVSNLYNLNGEMRLQRIMAHPV